MAGTRVAEGHHHVSLLRLQLSKGKVSLIHPSEVEELHLRPRIGDVRARTVRRGSEKTSSRPLSMCTASSIGGRAKNSFPGFNTTYRSHESLAALLKELSAVSEKHGRVLIIGDDFTHPRPSACKTKIRAISPDLVLHENPGREVML